MGAGFRTAANEAVENKKMLQTQKKELADVGKIISEVELLTLPLGDEGPAEQADELKSLQVQSAQESLNKWQANAKSLEQNPHGAMKLSMGRLLKESEKFQTQLNEVYTSTRDWREPAMCRIFVREGRAKMTKVEEAMARAEEAEGPFLKGIEILSIEQSTETITTCEAAALATQTILNEVKSFLATKCKEVSAYKCSDEASKMHISTLSDLLQSIGGIAKKLDQYRNDMEKRKRAALSHDD